ncbi:MAG: diguanylate cyclase [Thermodesulfovibrionales bacterium]|nr:diguanylate cyclase [Thermodesulfovibrionales bacterium]
MRILIVDDNPFDLNYLTNIVRQSCECDIVQFSSSSEALKWCNENNIDILVVDCIMPSPNGIEFVYYFKQMKKNELVPIIMATMAEEREVKYQALQMGVNFFVPKPIDHIEFLVILNNAITMRNNYYALKKREQQLTKSEEKFRILAERLPSCVVIFKNLKVIYSNTATQKILGIDSDTLMSMSFKDLIKKTVPKRLYHKAIYLMRLILDGIEFQSEEIELINASNQIITVVLSTSNIVIEDEKGTICIATDITKQKETELRAIESERRLTTLINNLHGIVFRCKNDKYWTMEYISNGCKEITEYTPEEILNNNVVSYNDIILEDDRDIVNAYVQRAISQFEPYVIEYRIRTKSGKIRWVWEKGIGVYDKNKNLIALEGYITDITDRKEAEYRLQYLAHYDPLTGLANRTLFFDRLEHAMKLAKRGSYLMALEYIDLDGFKFINDTYGHDVGDEVLKETAKRLSQCVRESDTVARIGGDEFTVILSKIKSKKNAFIVAQKIIDKLSEPFNLKRLTLNISASIGISIYFAGDDDTDSLIKKADIAMYRAKQSGKNRYPLYIS